MRGRKKLAQLTLYFIFASPSPSRPSWVISRLLSGVSAKGREELLLKMSLCARLGTNATAGTWITCFALNKRKHKIIFLLSSFSSPCFVMMIRVRLFGKTIMSRHSLVRLPKNFRRILFSFRSRSYFEYTYIHISYWIRTRCLVHSIHLKNTWLYDKNELLMHISFERKRNGWTRRLLPDMKTSVVRMVCDAFIMIYLPEISTVH